MTNWLQIRHFHLATTTAQLLEGHNLHVTPIWADNSATVFNLWRLSCFHNYSPRIVSQVCPGRRTAPLLLCNVSWLLMYVRTVRCASGSTGSRASSTLGIMKIKRIRSISGYWRKKNDQVCKIRYVKSPGCCWLKGGWRFTVCVRGSSWLEVLALVRNTSDVVYWFVWMMISLIIDQSI